MGERQVRAMYCGAKVRTPLLEPEVLEGREGMPARLACMAVDRFGWLSDDLAALLEQFGESETAANLADAARQLAGKAAELGSEKAEAFWKENLPALRKKAEEYRDELERSGRLDEARQFWERFQAWVREIGS
jgi:hypothetical protein